MNYHKIETLSKEENDFPTLLGKSPNTPGIIYLKGNKHILSNKSVSIVGTRKASALGLKTAEGFAYQLARAGFTIVSGLAMGIDTAAHKGALKAGGKTIAVLGVGIDKIYPSQNEFLAQEIIKTGGAIVSEYRVGVTPYKGSFIARNRIISGLSLATIVIEAPKKSGALATAGFAGDQGKSIFVTPGDINNFNYEGSHALIRDGATLVTSVNEILEELNVDVYKEKIIPETITKEVEIVFNTIKKSGQVITIDSLIEATGMKTNEIISALGTLSIEQMIIETPYGYIPA